MTIACPACRAENAERTAESACRRCRADLSLLWDLEGQRQALLARAAAALLRRDCLLAIECAQQASAIRNDAEAAQMIACAHLLRGKFSKALEWRQIAASRAASAAG